MIVSFIADRCPTMPILSAVRRLLLPGLLLASGHTGAATYGLDQLIARARAESPLLAVYRAEELAARAGLGTARAYPNPELEYTPGRAQGRAAGSLGGFASGLSISQPIENPALRNARIGTAHSRVDVAIAQTSAARVNLDALVARRFFDLQRIREETQAYAEDLALAEQIRHRVEVRVSTGEAPRFDLIRAESEVAVSRRNLESSALRVRQASYELKRTVSPLLEDDFRIQVADPATVTPLDEAAIDALRQRAVQTNTEIEVAMREVERASRQIGVERQSVLPRVSIRGVRDRDPSQVVHQLGVQLTVPLLDRREGPIQEAQALAERARLALEQKRFEIETSFDAAVQAWRAADAEVRAIESGILERARRVVAIAEAAYRSGERGILEFLDAQRQYRLARNELIQARHGLNVARTELERLAAPALVDLPR